MNTLMSRPKVYYDHLVPDAGPDLLRPLFNVNVHQSLDKPSPEVIIAQAHDAFGLCTSLEVNIDKELITHLPNLKVISSYARGFDNIDIKTASNRGIVVACVDGQIIDSTVADLTWALLLGLARKLVLGDRTVRNQGYKGWSPVPDYNTSVSGKIIGIIGMGRLGQAVAKRSRGFEMSVLYYQPLRLPVKTETNLGITYSPKYDLLSLSDFICVCSPLIPETYHQIGEQELRAMKPSTLLINTSRGSQVDEGSVAKALVNGVLAGYAADVFEMEDQGFGKTGAAIPHALLEQTSKTLFSPHWGTAVPEARVHMARIQAQAVLDVWQGRIPIGAVNVAK